MDRCGTVQFSSVAQSCPTLCNPMKCSTPGLLVHNQLPEFTQSHIHWVGDAIQPAHPLSSPSPPTSIFPNIRIFWNKSALCIRWPKYRVSTSASVLPINTQDWFPLRWTGWISLQSEGLSRVFSTPQFKSINSLVLNFLHSPTLTSSGHATVSYLSITTLNANGLNAPTTRQRLAEWIQKQDLSTCCLQKNHLKTRDTCRLKVKGWKKKFHANGDQ